MSAIIAENIPLELKALPQWLLWRLENRGGKPSKIPYSVHGGMGKSNDSSTWAPFDTTVKTYLNGGKYSGIGFAFSEHDELTGLDLDHVIDPSAGLSDEALEIVERFEGTYCEASPSGTGIRIFCKGKLPRCGKNAGKVKWLEAYDHTSPRYLTVTSNHLDGTAKAVTEQQAALDWLYEKYFKAAAKPKAKPQTATSGKVHLSDDELIAKALTSRGQFRALWNGDTSAYGDDDSAADLALTNLLAFWCNHDLAAMDRLFRQSKLMRPKWDEMRGAQTYGQMTIAKALDGSLGAGYGNKPTGSDAGIGGASQVFKSCGELTTITKLACLATDAASAQSINECTTYPAVIAGSAAALWKTAKALRKAYPQLKLLVCGDADPGQADKARIAAFSLIGGSYWCFPNFLQPGSNELKEAAIARMSKPPEPGSPIPAGLFKEAAKALQTRDEQRIAEESPATFADLAGWFAGGERVAQQIETAISQISVIRLQSGKLSSIVDRAEKETLFYGAGFYQRVGMLVRPVKQDVSTEENGVRLPAGALVLTSVSLPWLNRRFSQAARWLRYDKRGGDWTPSDPPTKYAETYLSMAGEWRVPILTGIVECPTLRRDGSLLMQSGYDPASGLYVDYRGEPVSVKDNPTRADALESLAILKTPFAEFPFAEGDIDLSVVLAGLLTAIVRRSLRTAPLFAIDAPAMGSGKGLIVNSIAMIATGRPAPAVSQGKDETEDEKRLGALLVRGVPLLNFDNCERELQGDLLCSALTEATVSVRILGKTEMPDMPANLTLFATGNNLRSRGDMVRRCLMCRIDARMERPDTRSFALNLTQYIPANRAQLLSAALTVLRAFIVAGKPTQDIPPYGSFEEWSDLVRSALVWLGMPDPNLTRARLEIEDPISTSLHNIFTLWFDAFGTQGITASEICQQTTAELRHALLAVATTPRDSEKVDVHRLGNWLRRHKGKVANGLRLEKVGENTDKGVVYWRIISLN